MSELKQALLDIEFLQECNNSANLALSVTRKELAAANARIAELKYKLMAQTETALQEIARREQAEAQCNEMEVVNTELQAQNKLMREALRKIINVTSNCLSHEEMKDKMKNIAKAALEEKP